MFNNNISSWLLTAGNAAFTTGEDLYKAVRIGYLSEVKQLTVVNSYNNIFASLLFAIKEKQIETTDFLLSSVEQTPENFKKILTAACESNDTDILALALEKDKQFNSKIDFNGHGFGNSNSIEIKENVTSLLMHAISNKLNNTANLLLSKYSNSPIELYMGSNIHVQGPWSRPKTIDYLNTAIDNNNVEIIPTILSTHCVLDKKMLCNSSMDPRILSERSHSKEFAEVFEKAISSDNLEISKLFATFNIFDVFNRNHWRYTGENISECFLNKNIDKKITFLKELINNNLKIYHLENIIISIIHSIENADISLSEIYADDITQLKKIVIDSYVIGLRKSKKDNVIFLENHIDIINQINEFDTEINDPIRKAKRNVSIWGLSQWSRKIEKSSEKNMLCEDNLSIVADFLYKPKCNL